MSGRLYQAFRLALARRGYMIEGGKIKILAIILGLMGVCSLALLRVPVLANEPQCEAVQGATSSALSIVMGQLQVVLIEREFLLAENRALKASIPVPATSPTEQAPNEPEGAETGTSTGKGAVWQ